MKAVSGHELQDHPRRECLEMEKTCRDTQEGDGVNCFADVMHAHEGFFFLDTV